MKQTIKRRNYLKNWGGGGRSGREGEIDQSLTTKSIYIMMRVFLFVFFVKEIVILYRNAKIVFRYL